METVKTNSGLTFESDYLAVIPYPAFAYIRIFAPLPTVAAVFADRNETIALWHGNRYLSGYTQLISLVPEGDAVKVCLAKE